MCGLVGVAGDLNNNIDRVLNPLLVFDSVRGEDSTGVAFIHRIKNSTAVVKAVGSPFELFNEGKYDSNIKRLNRALIGHNRFATTGAVNRANAHPFDFDTLVGVHNGTLRSKYKLPDHMDFRVDSAALFNAIEMIGLKDAIAPLGGDGNAWSLVWWDKLDETLNFLRNKERPMWMCRSEDSKQLFWASEYWMLDVALARAGVKRSEIFSTDEDTHYSVHIDDKGVMHKPRVEIVKADAIIPYVAPNVHKQQDYRKPPALTLAKGGTADAVPFPVSKRQEEVKRIIQELKELEPDDAPDKGAEVKKLEVPAKTEGLASDPCYVSSLKRNFEILLACRDGNGGRYLSLFDEKEPNVDIRLYPHKDDWELLDMEGECLTGNIQSFANKGQDSTAQRGYYKVSPWSVEYAKPLAIGDDDEMTVIDHKGKLITETQFKQAYPTCGWCSANLSILDKNRYTTAGDCLCPACAKDAGVINYVNIV